MFSRVTLVRRDFHFALGKTPRWAHPYQRVRRSILARCRNTLLMRALDDEDWVLWLDADVIAYPADIVEQLLALDGPTFDLNAWADHGRRRMQDFRGAGRPVRLDAVGGTMLLVRADRHRDGLIFPPFPYGLGNPAVRPAKTGPSWGIGELETEGLGIMARDMGLQCWGLPDLEILHASD